MSLRTILSTKLPERLLKDAEEGINPAALGREVDYTCQAVHLWFNKDELPTRALKRIMKIPGHSLSVNDLRPYCRDLDAILSMVEAEAGASV